MIIFDRVTKQFGTDAYALRDVSFSISPGELVCITGPSGSGKTTLMKLLTREYIPSEGEVYFDEVSLGSLKSSKVPQHRRQIGVIFQDYKLLSEYNVWENIALPLYILNKKEHEIEERVTDLLKLVNLTDKAYSFPSQLSGGEAQRVSIARALATGPKVIFADEPTGNLDPETSITIAKLLHKINELGTTVLLATHDLGVLEILEGERHIQLDKGQLIKDSKPKTDKADKPKKPAKHPESTKHDAKEKEVEEDKKDSKSESTEVTEPAKPVKETKKTGGGWWQKLKPGSKKVNTTQSAAEPETEEEEIEIAVENLDDKKAQS
jgi:cell division transport system ATP-binding protein